MKREKEDDGRMSICVWFARIMLYIYIGVCRVYMFNGVVSECMINEICV
jgi:hypothetical protein